MMERIIIICEGNTEKQFCSKTLSPHFLSRNKILQSPLIKKTGGGIGKWNALKKEIESYLKKENDVIVTTLIDYYGINSKHSFPSWEDANSIIDKNKRMDFLENSMLESIDEEIRFRFKPYIQLHEFEGLLFNDIKIFTDIVSGNDIIGMEELKKTLADYSNPEMINEGKNTSPSKRLERCIKGYDKEVYGNILAEAIGLENLRNKSPRFNNWITLLENL